MAKLNPGGDSRFSLDEYAALPEAVAAPERQSRLFCGDAKMPHDAQSEKIDPWVVSEPLSGRARVAVIAGLASLSWAMMLMLGWSVLYIWRTLEVGRLAAPLVTVTLEQRTSPAGSPKIVSAPCSVVDADFV